MDREEIIRMAREAGLSITTAYGEKPELARFAALVAKHEREACAKVCDTMATPATSREAQLDFHWAAGCCAAAIRARGEK